MPTGNLDDPQPPIVPQTTPSRGFRLPADYYCAPLSEVRPILPKWAPYGCGAGAALFLVTLFMGGALMTGPRLAALLDFVIGTSLGEMRPMFAPNIAPETKAQFEQEVKGMREGMRQGKVSASNVQSFLRAMQRAIADKKVSSEELEAMTRVAHEAAQPASKR